MIYITRREVFSASHRIYNPQLSDEENFSLYGKCSNPNGHGHNYTLEVTITGEVNPETGYLIDLKKLKSIIRENVIDKLDHKNLNLDVDFLKDKIPTSENIVLGIWNQLAGKIPNGKLYSIKLYETENNYIEYRGE
ncbi:putative 6-pyruvoyltetrahydropterin synthase (6-pyruvoyl tetrahydrobiopterin) synthase [Melioribacter roseus P3M-2]|uniref:6-carboxy-5,6,7,8-tetrahydropterin synthase n=1 Tax=Melioribacter roseus (strain DSM 23840 / JCM 17771 / VKM B-2668 / P3M-2) TaxID=1191523 RepID=I7A5N8_MELRP|nr:6-carboxytetrahydropterin synthase [Melioribacter roseus]AFN75216.1 putative 6-pyruvoyltetrahydropterin synthase (6-pyruvoyl tetrahydrobiopterin) synthase [Melioribacter roseus P3M-2]